MMTFDINLVLRINNGELPNPGQYDHLVDYFNGLNTSADMEEERTNIAKIDDILKLETLEDKWNYAEWELEGNIIDSEYKYFCWIDTKEFTPRLVLNYVTGELHLEYVLSNKFIPRFKIEKDNLLTMLNEWEQYITRR